jgi:hypothetical protein
MHKRCIKPDAALKGSRGENLQATPVSMAYPPKTPPSWVFALRLIARHSSIKNVRGPYPNR